MALDSYSSGCLVIKDEKAIKVSGQAGKILTLLLTVKFNSEKTEVIDTYFRASNSLEQKQKVLSALNSHILKTIIINKYLRSCLEVNLKIGQEPRTNNVERRTKPSIRHRETSIRKRQIECCENYTELLVL